MKPTTRSDRPAALVGGIAATWRSCVRDVGFKYGVRHWVKSLLRPLRVLAFPRAHRRLLALPIYRDFGRTLFRDRLFHHLSHPYYLRRGLDTRQRIKYVLDHYFLESVIWTQTYRLAVYGQPGLELWRHEHQGTVVAIRLRAGERVVPEGDLQVSLMVDDLPLHHINFSWLIESQGASMVPFVGRSQGCAIHHPEAMVAFERCFPQNSAPYFCYSAIPGIARVVGSAGVRGVRAHEQVCANLVDSARFSRIYDGFWRDLGGTDDGGAGIFIPLPDYDRPPNQTTHSRRKRARNRRQHWAAIESATVAALTPHFVVQS